MTTLPGVASLGRYNYISWAQTGRWNRIVYLCLRFGHIVELNDVLGIVETAVDTCREEVRTKRCASCARVECYAWTEGKRVEASKCPTRACWSANIRRRDGEIKSRLYRSLPGSHSSSTDRESPSDFQILGMVLSQPHHINRQSGFLSSP